MQFQSSQAIDERIDSATVKRPLTDAINAANVALNYYELAPGDSFVYGYHMHENQEELFVIQEGRVTFETEDGEVVVTAGDVVRFAPGEYQQGINRADERVVALAIGAPQETSGSEILRDCDACGERTPNTVERAQDGQAKITRCLECGNKTGRFD
ncbi:cupin domain-containing protein [Natrinema salaciae]|uniref:Cupin domain-containing protein n=1 Tax=Natrinema salaciae TaxID=1186196 RepID=A0A1H9P271_9EURY|nr:cupin domain-containing protein [Natrinema salaciae]SER42290.1 Cupin domain-containing protein [Natrinema salaciae]